MIVACEASTKWKEWAILDTSWVVVAYEVVNEVLTSYVVMVLDLDPDSDQSFDHDSDVAVESLAHYAVAAASGYPFREAVERDMTKV